MHVNEIFEKGGTFVKAGLSPLTIDFEKAVRALMKDADKQGLPLAKRKLIVTGTMGTVYGATLQLGEDAPGEGYDIKLVCQGPQVVIE